VKVRSNTDDAVAHAAATGEDLASLAAFQELILERSHDLITIMEPAGTIVYGSPSWRSIGLDPGEMVGRSALDFVHPDDVPAAAAALDRALAGGTLDAITLRLGTGDGTWAWFESNGSPILGSDDEIAYLVGTSRDVSEREELRRRVAEVDALYRIADCIGRATSLDELLAEAIDILLEATRADRASVLLLDDDGVMRFRAWRGLSEEYRAGTEGHSPWAADAVDAEAVLVADLATAGFPEELARVVQAEGIAALAFVPLVHGGPLLGKFMLYHDRPHVWDADEVKLCRTIASHLAAATVRSLTQEELRASSDRLSTIMRTVDEGIVMQSQAGELVYVNEAAARLVGFATTAAFLSASREGVLAQFEILDEDREPLPPDALPGRRALHGETSEQVVCYRIRSTGEERWSVVRANPVYDADGEVALSVSVIRDISTERNALELRTRAEERIRFLARASDLLYETLDYELTLAAIAEMAVPMFAGQVVIDLLDEDGSVRCVGAAHADPGKSEYLRDLRRRYPPTADDHPVQIAIRTGEHVYLSDVQEHVDEMSHDPAHAEEIRRLANTSGIVAPLIARGRTLGTIQLGTIDPQPRFTGADVDLAVELARRASLALDNARLYREAQGRAHAASALEFVDDGVFLLDGDDVIRLWNPAAAQTFRVKPARAIGRPVRELIRDWSTVQDRIRVAEEPSSGSGRAQTVPVDVHGEERWLSISAVRFPGGTVYAFRDLTEERAVDQLKSDFVATVSHELRTPLAAIYGAALTLKRDDVRLEDSQREGLLDVVASEADRLARIVNDILWASRLDSGQMGVSIESCDAAKLANQVVNAVRAHAPDRIELVVDAPGGLPAVAADPDKLRQVLTNLVDNAVKYSPDGGRVLVEVSHTGQRIRFRVEDRGLGIPPSEQTRIFEKFFRLDPGMTRGVGGTGLGLYICRELVYRMHGRIWVSSDGRSGSTFTVELPVAS
jgi:PAS domain S-box-containing protein